MSVFKIGTLERTEKLVLVYVLVLLVFGVSMSWINVKWFNEVYCIEDGFIESLTVLPLVVVAILTARYALKLSKKRSWMFAVAMIGLCLFCIFAAGEEISWGQRILGIQSSEFFQKNNAQQETNFHNMVVGGVKLNKLIFSQLFTLGAVVYLIVIPYFYGKKGGFQRLVDRVGIPVPRLYQTLALIVVSLFTAICNGRSSELQEFGACTIFFLIVLYPRNREVFR